MSEYKNEILINMWTTKKGHFKSMPLDAKAIEALAKAAQGDGLLLRIRTEESIQSAKNPETAPRAFLELVPKETMDEYKKEKPRDRTAASFQL